MNMHAKKKSLLATGDHFKSMQAKDAAKEIRLKEAKARIEAAEKKKLESK